MSSIGANIKAFTDRYPHAGLAFWVLCVQYFLVQIVVGLEWITPPYSVRFNTISDLGNTVCGIYGGRNVCSPLNGWMNVSFIILGISMLIGSILNYHAQSKSRAAIWGFVFMGIAGAGSILVGLFPENTIRSLHISGATLTFILGNLALIIFGMTLVLPKALRYYTIASGIIALAALGFFATKNYFGLGIGGMERLTAYPQTVWLILFGIYMSRTTLRSKKHRSKRKFPN